MLASLTGAAAFPSYVLLRAADDRREHDKGVV